MTEREIQKMNKKYNKSAKAAMVALLATTSFGYTANTIFANDNVVIQDAQKAEQTLTVTVGKDSIKVNESTAITVSGAQGLLSYASSDSTIATVDENGNVNGVAEGTVTITVTAEETDSHNAATETVTLTVTKADLIDITGSTVTLDQGVYVYGAIGREPIPTVQLGDKTLVKDVDYEVTYENNVNAGEGSVIIKGIGYYTGTVTKTFVIQKAQTEFTSIIIDEIQQYTGEEIRFSGFGADNVWDSSATIAFYKREGMSWVKMSEGFSALKPSEVGIYKLVITIPGTENVTGAVAEKVIAVVNEVDVTIPEEGGTITNPDNSTIAVSSSDFIHSNGLIEANADTSITFPNGGSVMREDGSVETIQKGAILTLGNAAAGLNGPQTGDASQVGLWATLAGLSAGLLYFFRNKKQLEK